jgi:hypothetical protein
MRELVVLVVRRFVAYGDGEGGAELTCSCPGQTNWPAGNGGSGGIGNGGFSNFGFAVSCLAQFSARCVAVCISPLFLSLF